MKHFFLLLVITAYSVSNLSFATDTTQLHLSNPSYPNKPGVQKTTVNFFIISKRKKGKLDLATRFNILRTSLRSFFHRKKFVSIVAKDASDMSHKMQQRLEKGNASLGTVWFDSHGMYKKGYSLFFIGHDEVSRNTLKDPALTQHFNSMAQYATEQSRFIIGSCYGGATYLRSSIDYKDTTRMDGDSLMMQLGKLVKKGNVLACESWVMSKPGLFWRKPATGGYPGRKLFQDLCYEPAWKHIGQWNEYDIERDNLSSVHTIALDRYGNMVVRGKGFIQEKNKAIDIEMKLKGLMAHLYK